jgi:hypothetical protein
MKINHPVNSGKFPSDFRKIIALAFVPTEDVERLFYLVQDDADTRLDPVLEHMHDTYVLGVKRGNKQTLPMFKPEWWNCYERVLGMFRSLIY